MIKRRDFLKKTILAGAAAAAAPMSFGLTEKKPNILFVFIDDMGFADPSCFGNYKIKTPNIDRLASEGTKLTNFYVNSPICSPSRVSVMTGQYPQRWRIHSYLNSRKINKKRGMANYLSTEAPVTAGELKRAGYNTAHFGKWHVGGGRDVDDAPLPQEYGFDESLVSFEGLGERLLFEDHGLSRQSAKLGHGKLTETPKHKTTEYYVNRSLKFMEKSVKAERPFYIELFPNDVHDWHLPKEGEAEKMESVTQNPWEQDFFAILKEMDKQLGRAFDKVKQLGIEDNTLIVFTSDNGPTDWGRYYRDGWTPPGSTGEFYGRKWSLYEGGIRMPFIAKWQGKIQAGTINSEAVCAGIDLSPTFLNVTGGKASAEKDGQDMMPALLGKNFERKKPICWQYGKPFATLMPGNKEFISPSFAVRDGKWKLLINPDGSNAELFDLQSDIKETTNLAAQKPDKVKELKAEIKSWAKDVGIEEAVKF
ncbi:sulfatase [Sedimentisphaera salicampi]|uniref:Arylsulfatase n=1 Tax=Sedimentisphaera salicampi TaxID=1941349 RepID=A0A1W6LKV2_9BACT|nr:sulfatase-like hydrolase/transferase [Sedimentisphaera salicampi]ARN56407.1 Arylsulfatase precursor [Sedimentisphaera salicampi]